jgi:hypothetical protein
VPARFFRCGISVCSNHIFVGCLPIGVPLSNLDGFADNWLTDEVPHPAATSHGKQPQLAV